MDRTSLTRQRYRQHRSGAAGRTRASESPARRSQRGSTGHAGGSLDCFRTDRRPDDASARCVADRSRRHCIERYHRHCPSRRQRCSRGADAQADVGSAQCRRSRRTGRDDRGAERSREAAVVQRAAGALQGRDSAIAHAGSRLVSRRALGRSSARRCTASGSRHRRTGVTDARSDGFGAQHHAGAR